MNPRDAARLMFVGLGVLCLVYAIAMIQGVFFSFGIWEGLFPRLANTAAAILPLLFFVWLASHLIGYRDRYSQHIFPDSPFSQGGISPDELHTIGLSLIGVLLVVSAIPQIFRYGTWAIINMVQAASTRSVITGEFGSPSIHYPGTLEELISSVGKLALGLFLVVIPRKITSFLLHRQEKLPAPQPEMRTCPSCSHPYSISDYREDAGAIFCSRCATELTGREEPEDH